jgi:hypothetical protein
MNPAYAFPKFDTIGIIIENEYVAFLDTCASQYCHATFNKLPSKALPTVIGMNCKMVDISSASIVTG